MTEILDVLRDTKEGEDIHVTKDEMEQIVTIFTFVSAALRDGRLWFNKPGKKYNKQFYVFCDRMAKKFSNIKIHQES